MYLLLLQYDKNTFSISLNYSGDSFFSNLSVKPLLFLNFHRITDIEFTTLSVIGKIKIKNIFCPLPTELFSFPF